MHVVDVSLPHYVKFATFFLSKKHVGVPPPPPPAERLFRLFRTAAQHRIILPPLTKHPVLAPPLGKSVMRCDDMISIVITGKVYRAVHGCTIEKTCNLTSWKSIKVLELNNHLHSTDMCFLFQWRTEECVMVILCFIILWKICEHFQNLKENETLITFLECMLGGVIKC